MPRKDRPLGRVQDNYQEVIPDFKLLAGIIASKLRDASAPGQSTWGDQYPDAHKDLYENYYEDMVIDIATILQGDDNLGKLLLTSSADGDRQRLDCEAASWWMVRMEAVCQQPRQLSALIDIHPFGWQHKVNAEIGRWQESGKPVPFEWVDLVSFEQLSSADVRMARRANQQPMSPVAALNLLLSFYVGQV